MKTYIIIAHNGQEIVDTTPEAKERIAAMEYMEERRLREYRRILEERRRRARNPLWRLAEVCGIV